MHFCFASNVENMSELSEYEILCYLRLVSMPYRGWDLSGAEVARFVVLEGFVRDCIFPVIGGESAMV